jgi:hypothetical protein
LTEDLSNVDLFSGQGAIWRSFSQGPMINLIHQIIQVNVEQFRRKAY